MGSGILSGICVGILDRLWPDILLYGLRGRDLHRCSFAGRPSLELT